MFDRAIYWMAAHPWSVGLMLAAMIVFVSALDRVPA